MNPASPIGQLGGSGHELPGEFPRTMHILFSNRMLSIAIGTAVLLPFVALAFASVHTNYATCYGFRKTSD